MATRFYLPDTAGTNTAPISPTQDAGWTSFPFPTGSRILMKTYKTYRTVAIRGTPSPGALNANYLVRQFISDPLLAQTISGTVAAIMRVQEINLTDNFFAASVFRVLSNDGTTVRGTLLSDLSNSAGTEFPLSASASTVKFPAGWTSPGATITSVDAKEGDRIVVELGWFQTSTSVANEGMTFGDAAATDHSGVEGETSLLNPWVEFSADLNFQQQFAPEQFYWSPLPAQMVGNQWGYSFFTLPNPAVGALFTQALTASDVVTTATLLKQVGKTVTATDVSTIETLTKQVGKVVSATSSTTATLIKQVGKILTRTVTTTATLVAAKVKLLTLSATVTTTATLIKQVNKILTATTVSTTSTLVKQVGKILSATVTTTATLLTQKVKLLTLSVTTSTTATMIRQVGKPLSVTVTTTATLIKQVGKTLSKTVTTTATLQALRVFQKVLTVTVTTTATISRQIQAIRTATVTTTASVAKRVTKTLTTTVSSFASLVASFVGQAVGPFAARLGIVDVSGPDVSLTDANIVSTSVVDATTTVVSVSDAPGADVGLGDVTGPSVQIDDIAP